MLSKFPTDVSLSDLFVSEASQLMEYLQIGVFFPWYPLFSSPPPPNQQDDFSLPGNLPQTSPSVLPDLQYERASILINIAATYAKMAVVEDRSSLEGNKKAMAHFSVSKSTMNTFVV